MLPGLAPTIARVAARVTAAIEDARPDSRAPLWGAALDATRAIAEAPQHHLRAQLVLLGDLAGGGTGEGPRVEQLAAGVELLHLFLLVHDDILDEALLRRGRPALHAAIGRAAPGLRPSDARGLAMVVGDLLSLLGTRAIFDADGAAARLVLDALRTTGAGQFEDVVGPRTLEPAAVRAQMEAKSAHQSFAAPLCAGLLLANPSADLGPARAWALHLGVALQAYDDIVDLVGDPAETGKDNLRDLIEGRSSLALAFLLQRASGEERAFLQSVIGAGALLPGERAQIQQLLAAHDVVGACRGFIEGEIAGARARSQGAPYPPQARADLALVEEGLARLAASLKG